MRNFVCLIVSAAVLSVAAASSQVDGNITLPTFDERMATIFEQGYNQIMLTNPSPACKKIALSSLAVAQDENNKMDCSSFTDKAEGVGQIFNQAWESFNSLIADLNTFVNGIPMCGIEHRWYNFFYSIPCLLGQFSDIWKAAKDFFYYSNFYMDTVHKVQDFVDCLTREKHATDSVKTALNLAAMCKY